MTANRREGEPTPPRDLPPFTEGLSRWVTFLRVQAGTSAEPLWVFREDIVEIWPALFVKTPLEPCPALVERIYEEGRRGGIGIHFSVACLLEQHPCCYVWVPQDEEQATYRMLSGLKLSIPTGPSLRTATPIGSSLRWAWLKWRERLAGMTRWVDDIPARANYTA